MGIKKNYIFTNKRYSEKSVMSTILGLISLGALIAAVYFTFRAGGQAMVGYGVTGLLAAVFSLAGLASCQGWKRINFICFLILGS